MISDVFVEKFSRLDLRINLNGNTSINVEIQVKNYENYKDRTLFYWSKLYTQGFKEGQDYAELKETIAINILDFNLFDCEEYHSVFGVFEETRREKLSDKFRIDFLELKKAKKFKEMNGTMATRKQMWMDFLNATSDDDETLSRLSDSTTNPVNSQAVGKAVAVLKKMSADEKTLYEIEAREKMLHDEASAIVTHSTSLHQSYIWRNKIYKSTSFSNLSVIFHMPTLIKQNNRWHYTNGYFYQELKSFK